MNIQLIRETESQNDGSNINLYWNKQIGAWCAYGYSAYGLRLFDKRQGYMNLRSYSDCLQMPCTVTSGESLGLLLQYSVEIGSQTATSIKLKMADTINFNAYQMWLHKLKGSSNDDAIIVTTHVSQYVPRDSFIPDGMSAFARNVKRISDFILSLIALTIFSPLFLICYIVIHMEDGGSAIFKQERIGRFGRPFYIYKFRSMRLDAEKFGPQLSHSGGDNDPRLTKIGRFIRAHHLDEFPQFINVLLGQMSLIGPRPYLPREKEDMGDYYYDVIACKPGITGMWQSHGRSDVDFEHRLLLDEYYYRNWSFWLDVTLLFKTIKQVLYGRGAV